MLQEILKWRKRQEGGPIEASEIQRIPIGCLCLVMPHRYLAESTTAVLGAQVFGNKRGEPSPSPPLGYDKEQQSEFKLKEIMEICP